MRISWTQRLVHIPITIAAASFATGVMYKTSSIALSLLQTQATFFSIAYMTFFSVLGIYLVQQTYLLAGYTVHLWTNNVTDQQSPLHLRKIIF